MAEQFLYCLSALGCRSSDRLGGPDAGLGSIFPFRALKRGGRGRSFFRTRQLSQRHRQAKRIRRTPLKKECLTTHGSRGNWEMLTQFTDLTAYVLDDGFVFRI